eukprot:1306496-Amphidinium_carterae.1
MQALDTVITAAALSAGDRKTLTALLQEMLMTLTFALAVQHISVQDHQTSEEDLGAPAPATYKSHGTNIIDTLEELCASGQGFA